MTNTFEWVITQMTTKPSEDGLTDVVVLVNYFRNLLQVDDDGKEWFAQSLGNYECPTPSSADFTPYPDLTEQQVIGWLEAGLDVASIDTYLETNIEFQKNPPTIILPNPWQTPS